MNQTEWLRCATVAEVQQVLEEKGLLSDTGVEEVLPGVRNADVRRLLNFFLEPEPASGTTLEPDLLLRHAAGQLYQEAHLILEREPQLVIPEFIGNRQPHGTMPRDIRFTPATLARILVQQAFDQISGEIESGNHLDALDPACGSGVFLIEVLRELQKRSYKGRVSLRGMDVSEVSCAMARFCIGRAKRDAESHGIRVDFTVEVGDALEKDWGHPTVIVMNPPFVSWEVMRQADRFLVEEVLGKLASGRVDKAMAFIWKAAKALKEGAVIATVLPAALFETRAGESWRAALR
ncbi:MAG: N-6 DNA methylase, partial [Armatimonadetes bacterium]|nr:N-6 DNA methylase [Armatimonadota bacterium]